MRLAFLALVCLGATPAWAQAPANQTPAAPAEPQYPKISIGTLSYFQYAAELKNRDGFNAFDVTRGYINIAGDIAKNVKFRITPDVRRITDGSLAGSLTFRLKFGFIEFDELMPRSWVRFGLHQSPWLDFEESINRYRVQGPMFAEREGIIPGSSDFGVGLLARAPNNYGEINVGVYNGEGFTRAETDKRKSIQARVTIRPMPQAKLASGLRISAFFDHGWTGKDRPKRHGIVMASYEHPHFVGRPSGWPARHARIPSSRTPSSAATRSSWKCGRECRDGLESPGSTASIPTKDLPTIHAGGRLRALRTGSRGRRSESDSYSTTRTCGTARP